MILQLPPLALYIHIPWCIRKCPYCDFNSHESNSIPEQAYAEHLLRDLQHDLHWVQERKLHSIFFGGGTPSIFNGDTLKTILQGVQQCIPFEDDIEITLEANPGTAEANKFLAFQQAGVNRLSLGIQSFNANHLKSLGRIHDSKQAIRAVGMAQAAGFERINIDLMHGLPEQNEQQALADLQQAIDLGVTHLSWYQLTIEPNTAFYRHPPILPVDDTLWDIQQAGMSLLQEHGFIQYEVSAFSQSPAANSASESPTTANGNPNTANQCRHNLNYWQFGDYLGIGAGAHGKITLPAENRIVRYSKTRLPKHYLDRTRHYYAEQHDIALSERPAEFMMNALRLPSGVAASLYPQRTGLSLSSLAATCEPLQQKGLLAPSTTHIATTPKGFQFLNDVLTVFL